MRVHDVVNAKLIRSQHWRVTLECGHKQDVHSIRDGGPAYVRHCHTCEPESRRERERAKK